MTNRRSRTSKVPPGTGWRDTGVRTPVGATIYERVSDKKKVGILTRDGDMQARDREQAERESRQRNV